MLIVVLLAALQLISSWEESRTPFPSNLVFLRNAHQFPSHSAAVAKTAAAPIERIKRQSSPLFALVPTTESDSER